jgi:deoxyadenosine/deoxycytidine kinase
MSDKGKRNMRVAVVGPCGAGKSTLVRRLRALGYDVREPCQEHSGVPDMWRRLSRPDLLIYLDADVATINRRLGRTDWTAEDLSRIQRRLAHARAHCDLYLATDALSADEVLARAVAFLEKRSGRAKGST